MPLTPDIPTSDDSEGLFSSQTLDVGPSWSTILARTARVLMVFLVCGAGVAGAVEVTHTTSARGQPMGSLGYQWLFPSPVKSGGLYLVNQDLAVMTPPIYDAGDAPLTLEKVTPLVTGCRARMQSATLYTSSLHGVEVGPLDTPRSQWRGFGIEARVENPNPVTLDPGNGLTGPEYVVVFTVEPPGNGPWGIEGYKVTFVSNGLQRVGYLDDPQVFIPSVASRSADGSLPGAFTRLLGQVGMTKDGATHGFDCQNMAPIPSNL